jgi:hypothetical protein
VRRTELLTGLVGQSNSNTASTSTPKHNKKEKEEPAPELTPLERVLQNAGPLREDGSDKFFGLENVCHDGPASYMVRVANLWVLCTVWKHMVCALGLFICQSW